MTAQAQVPQAPRIHLSVKLVFTLFMLVLVPYYWIDYGPTNFLYYCDVALFLTLIALWKEWPLPASMGAVGIVVVQFVWIADFFANILGFTLVGMTDYMFKPSIPLFTRALSFFHFWLPLFLLWVVWRLGYDRRAFVFWTCTAWILMLVCYFLMPLPPAPIGSPNLPVNINYVYGPSELAVQTWMPPLAYLGLLMTALPLLVYWPTHYVLAKVYRRR